MEYRSLGYSGVKVSRLCIGAMTFGEADNRSFMHQVCCDEDTSYKLMNKAYESGINFIDTADIYGQDGLSERIIGNWLSQNKLRDSFVLATKFRFRSGSGPNGAGASRYRIMKTVEDSLKRLKTDRIDLYQIHMQDSETPEEEILRALDDLIHQGKVLYIGASNYTGYRLVDSLWISNVKNLNRFVTLQAQYSLIFRDIEREIVPSCDKFGLGILTWAPLAKGFLSGKYKKGENYPSGARLTLWSETFKRFDTSRNWEILAATEQIARDYGTTPSRVAIAWLLAQNNVTSVIIGARTLEQFDDNLRSVDLLLAPEDVQYLSVISAMEWGYPYDFIAKNQSKW